MRVIVSDSNKASFSAVIWAVTQGMIGRTLRDDPNNASDVYVTTFDIANCCFWRYKATYKSIYFTQKQLNVSSWYYNLTYLRFLLELTV